MALQIRRGLEADLPTSPADGELLYATDTNTLYVGNGGAAQEISGGAGASALDGLSDVTLIGTPSNGQVLKYDGAFWSNSGDIGLINLIDDATPQLGGDLDVNGYKIVSTSNGNIELDPNGTGNIVLHGNLTISSTGNIFKTGQLNITSTTLTSFGNDTTLVDGNVAVTRNSYAGTPGSGFLFQQHHETPDAVNFTFFRSRGTGLARTSVVNGDDLADISFISHDGISGVGVGSITCSVDGVVSTGKIPGKFTFALHDGITSGTAGLRDVAEIDAAGVFKTDSIQNIGVSGQLTISPATLTVFGNDTTLIDGNVTITRNAYSAAPGAGFTFSQHHSTADSVNFTFFRTRGTGLARTSVLNNDDIADISFIGHDGTSGAGVGNITCQVDGTVSTGRVPGRFGFLLHDGITSGGAGIREVAQLNSAGTWKVNSIQNYNGTDLTLTATTVNIAGDVQINARGDLRFADLDSSNWVALQAPAAVSANVTWTLPNADGSNGQVLTTDGAGTLSWATASGATGLTSRATVLGTTGSIADGVQSDVTIANAYKGYILYKIETNVAAWVRVYVDVPSRTSDATRLEGTDPLPGSGVVAEVITTGAQTILLSPGTIGFNNEASPTTNMYLAITNKSGSTTSVIVTLTILQIEA